MAGRVEDGVVEAGGASSRIELLYAGLRRRVSRQQYTTWFERTKALRWADRELVLGVPNRFFQEWLQKNFLSIIGDVANEIDGAPVHVGFQVLTEAPEEATNGEAAVSDMPPSAVPTVPAAPTAPAYQPTPFVGSGANDVPLRLNEHYTFENFIMGPSNSVAYASAMAVAQKPGRAYNPLFIHGAVGLGKTHLLHAICREFLRNAPQDRICFLSCEEFLSLIHI